MTSAEATSAAIATEIAEFSEDKEISALEFSPDGTRLSTVEWTGSEVHVWHWQSEKRIEQRLRITQDSGLYTLQSGIKFSPDGTELATDLRTGLETAHPTRILPMAQKLTAAGRGVLVAVMDSDSKRDELQDGLARPGRLHS